MVVETEASSTYIRTAYVIVSTYVGAYVPMIASVYTFLDTYRMIWNLRPSSVDLLYEREKPILLTLCNMYVCMYVYT